MDKSPSERAANKDVVFVSRQPIYNRSIDLFAYELLYSREVLEQTLAAKAEKVRNEAFLNTFLDFGLDSNSLAFINVTQKLIVQNYCKALPKDGVVLEISRQVEPEEIVMRSLTELHELGYKLALDDFDYSDRTRPMLDFADFVSLDFERNPREEISKQIQMLKQSAVKAVAKRVETYEVLEIAKFMGFEYFSGSCVIKPKITSTRRVPTNRLSTLQLVMKLQEPELHTSELERIVSQDLAISYKLLHYVNSAALSLPKNIESIRAAIQLVGMEHLRAWASLLFLSKLDDKPTELIITAVVRAKMAECLASSLGAKSPETYYMVGLFSLLGALLNTPLPEAIQLLPFSKEVREALLNRQGQLGSVLKCVLAYESGDWTNVNCGNLDAWTIRQCYLNAITAARKMPSIARTAEPA